MTSASGGSFEAMVQGASAESAIVGNFEPVEPHFAALNARSVAGEVASPGTGLARTCGVFGEERSCEGGSTLGCVGAVGPCSEGLGSPRLCVPKSIELAKENSRGYLKTGVDDFTGLSASAGPLRFFDWVFVDAVLASFGGLPRFFGATSAMAASTEAAVEVFFGLPHFLGALSTATGLADSSS